MLCHCFWRDAECVIAVSQRVSALEDVMRAIAVGMKCIETESSQKASILGAMKIVEYVGLNDNNSSINRRIAGDILDQAIVIASDLRGGDANEEEEEE